MTIAIGDNVKTKDEKPEYGKVTDISGSDVTYKTASGTKHTTKSSNLEAATGFRARLGQFGPDIGEVIANVAIFSVGNLAFKKKLMSKENMEFAVEDAVYEFVLKKWAREQEDKLWTRKSIPQKDIEQWFASQDLTDALSKTTSIAVMDIVYRLVVKKGVNYGAVVYFMKVLAAFYISNVGSRKLMGKKAGDPYWPQ